MKIPHSMSFKHLKKSKQNMELLVIKMTCLVVTLRLLVLLGTFDKNRKSVQLRQGVKSFYKKTCNITVKSANDYFL